MQNRTWRVCAIGAIWWCGASLALAADTTPEQRRDGLAALPWVQGPQEVAVGPRAQLNLGAGQRFLVEKDSGKFLELTGNLPSPGESIMLADGWWAAFDFAEVGYVKDDEKLDPDALLKQFPIGGEIKGPDPGGQV